MFLCVDGRRHVHPVQYGGPKKWRWCGRGKMAAGARASALLLAQGVGRNGAVSHQRAAHIQEQGGGVLTEA